MFLFQIEGREQESKLNFIKNNWQGMNDAEMAKHLQCSEVRIRLMRLKLRLKRKRGNKKAAKTGFKSKVSRQWLQKALNKDGQTEQEVAEMFGVSRQRVHQVCKEWGIAINRTPKLKVDSALITHRYAKRVKVICECCGAEIEKLESWIRENQKRHFCNNTCQGRWLGTNFGGGRKPSWTTQEDDFIRANYLSISDTKMAEHLERSYFSVRKRRLYELGLKKRG